MTPYRPLDLPLRPPLRACQGKEKGGSASCPHLIITTEKTSPALNTPTRTSRLRVRRSPSSGRARGFAAATAASWQRRPINRRPDRHNTLYIPLLYLYARYSETIYTQRSFMRLPHTRRYRTFSSSCGQRLSTQTHTTAPRTVSRYARGAMLSPLLHCNALLYPDSSLKRDDMKTSPPG